MDQRGIPTTKNSSQFHSTQSPFAFNSMNESHVCKTISSQNVFNVWYPCALECWTEIMRVAFLFVTHFPKWLSSKCPPTMSAVSCSTKLCTQRSYAGNGTWIGKFNLESMILFLFSNCDGTWFKTKHQL